MHNILNIITRQAVLGDAPEIARVHIASWKMAYKGLIHQSYLDDGLDLVERIQAWTENLQPQEAEDSPTYVALVGDDIIGFVRVGSARDVAMDGFMEVYTIYTLSEYFACGVGSMLFDQSSSYFQSIDCEKLYVWVLKDNLRGRQFYERMGGVLKRDCEK